MIQGVVLKNQQEGIQSGFEKVSFAGSNIVGEQETVYFGCICELILAVLRLQPGLTSVRLCRVRLVMLGMKPNHKWLRLKVEM